jgi:hypothetical protein
MFNILSDAIEKSAGFKFPCVASRAALSAALVKGRDGEDDVETW